MQTGSVGSSLSEFIAESSAGSNSSHSQPSHFQEVAASLGLEVTGQPDPAGIQTPSLSSRPSAFVQIGLPATGVSSNSAYTLSTNPIWDTGWEIEPQTPELGQAAIASLRGLFAKNGLGDESVKLSYIEELAVCPGVRSWVNRSVVVEYPDGQLEKFSAEWTQKRPEWTLCSMLERMGAEGPVQVVT